MSTENRRLPALDEMRGLAILGTFAANVWLFAAAGGPAALLLGGIDSGPVETVLRALVNGKFLALLTLLFGVGMQLQYASAQRRGQPWPGRYRWRAGLLFAEGLLHYVLVFEFDVLMGYAIASLVVAYLVGRSARVQAVAATVAGAVLALIVGAAPVAGVAGPAAGGGPAPSIPADYPGQVLARLVDWPLFRIELLLIVPGAVVLFLLGARLARASAFTATAAGERIRRRMAVVGAVGVVLNVATSAAGPALFVVDRYLAAPLVAVGLAAVVTSVVLRMRGPAGPARRGLAAIGRTAMSCYVLQNVVAAVLFLPWGLDLGAALTGLGDGARSAAVVAVWAAVCAGSALASYGWLGRFGRGPLELATHGVLRRVPVTRR